MPSTNGHGPKRAILYARVSYRRAGPLWLHTGPTARGDQGEPRGDTRYFYYRCSLRARHGKDACPQHKSYPAEEVEEAVWRVVFGLLKDPQTLRVGGDDRA